MYRKIVQAAVMVDLGVAQVFVGEVAEAIHGVLDAQASPPDLPQHLGNFFRGQFLRPPTGRSCSASLRYFRSSVGQYFILR